MTVAALLLVQDASAAVLEPQTIAAWEDHVARAKARMKERLKDPAPISCRPCGDEITAVPTDRHPMKSVPSGLIHDWTGAVFIPGARIEDVFKVLRDYQRYPEFYGPQLLEGRLIERHQERDSFSVTVRNRAVLGTFVLNGDYTSVYQTAGGGRWTSISESTRIQEIDDYGLPSEHKSPVNDGRGYLWRLCTLSIFEQRDGGVYLQVQAMGLSRDIPGSVKWLVEPIVRRVSRNAVITSLRQTREAVMGNHK